MLSCLRCGKTAKRERWHNLAHTGCAATLADGEWTLGAPAASPWQWRRAEHQVRRTEKAWECTRCGGHVPLRRRAALEGRRCPAWRAAPTMMAEGTGEELAFDWGKVVFGILGRRHAGAAVGQPAAGDAKGRQAAEPAPMVPDAATPAVAEPRRLCWRAHVGACGPGWVACGVCGRAASTWAKLVASPCAGPATRLPPRVAALRLVPGLRHAGGAPAVFAAFLAG